MFFNQLKVAKLPFLINDGKWHHICVTWTTRDGVWEAFQDGVMRGSGENLAPYHPIKPNGLLILGQEQVEQLSVPILSPHEELSAPHLTHSAQSGDIIFIDLSTQSNLFSHNEMLGADYNEWRRQ